MLFFPVTFFGYYLFSALFEYISVASLGEWVDALPGLLIIMMLFLMFAVPFWAVCVGRHIVSLDLPQHKILKVFDIRYYRWVKTYHIDQVQHVRVVRLRGQRTPYSHSNFCRVELRLKLGKPIFVSHGDRPDHARMIAEKVASHLGVSAF